MIIVTIITLKCTHRRSSDHKQAFIGRKKVESLFLNSSLLTTLGPRTLAGWRPENSLSSTFQFIFLTPHNSLGLEHLQVGDLRNHQGPNHTFLRSKSIWQFRSSQYWKLYRHQPLNLYFQHQLWPGLTYIWLIFNEYSTHFQLIFNLYLNTNHCQVWQSCVFSTWSTTN